MELWQIIGIISIALFILEIFTPTMFFLGLAIAALLTALISVWYNNIYGLVIAFVVLAVIVSIFIKPILNKNTSAECQTGIEGKYIGKTAKVESDITKDSGVISIYGERWEARVESDDIIPAGSEVRIIKNNSLIMFVERI